MTDQENSNNKWKKFQCLLTGESCIPDNKPCYGYLAYKRYKEMFPDDEILPVCPLIKEVVNKEKFPDITNLPKDSSKKSSLERIQKTFQALTKRQPTYEFLIWCAHRDNILLDCIVPIKEDLRKLPKRYSRDLRMSYTFDDYIIKLCDSNSFNYVKLLKQVHKIRAFMLPPDEFLTDYKAVLEWQKYREKPENTVREFKACKHISEIASLIGYYPAPAIELMDKILLNINDAEEIIQDEIKSQPQENGGGIKRLKEPSKEDCKIYLYVTTTGESQGEAAKILFPKLKKTTGQSKISRAMTKVRKWLVACGLPTEQALGRIREITVDPARIDLGERTDSKRHGDPVTNRLKDEDDQYED